MRVPRRTRRVVPLLAAPLALLAACTDAPTGIAPPAAARLESSEGRGYFQRYFAIGTSISEGIASDGLLAASQEQSWPAQLARLAHRDLSLPLVQWPGCGIPLAAPLVSFRRVDGSSVAAPFSCAPNAEGVVLPTDVVAVEGSRVHEALYGPDPANAERVLKNSRVLPAGVSQVAAMRGKNPKLVSVELGANEVLGARTGLVAPGVTVVPYAAFIADYARVVDSLEAVAPKAVVLVGLVDDMAAIPAFRTGAELWAKRAEFQQLGIVLTEACNTTNADNLVVTSYKVPQLVAAAAQRGAPQVFACNDAGGVDYVLTPADRATVNALMAQMNSYIEAQATAHGWAYFRLADLYQAPGVRGDYSPVRHLTSTTTPFTSYISLDGFHPSGDGQALLAAAAARALNQAYGMELPTFVP